MKKILYIATIGLTLLTSSCNDFLDRQVPQGIVPAIRSLLPNTWTTS